MPESPRWLESIGRYEAEVMLQQIQREVALQQDSLSRPAVALPPPPAVLSLPSSDHSFSPGVRVRAVGLCNTLGRTATIFTPFLWCFCFVCTASRA